MPRDRLALAVLRAALSPDLNASSLVFGGIGEFLELGELVIGGIGGIGDPLPILTSERHCHSERLFLYPIMLPIDLISCKLVLQLFLICTFNFSGLLLLPVPTFLECVSLMKSKMSQYLA